MMLYVRWMGAFRGRMSMNLADCLAFEFSGTRQFATESIICSHKRGKSWLASRTRTQFGVLYDSSDIVAKFSGDVWSEVSKNGSLIRMGTQNHHSDHTECWTRKGSTPCGIVLPDTWGGLKSSVLKKIYTLLQAQNINRVYTVDARGNLHVENVYKEIERRALSFTKGDGTLRSGEKTKTPQIGGVYYLTNKLYVKTTHTRTIVRAPRR